MPQFKWDVSRFDTPGVHWDPDPNEGQVRMPKARLSRGLKERPVADQINGTKPITDACAANVAQLGDTAAECTELTAAKAALETASNGVAAAKAGVTNAVNTQTNARTAFKDKFEKLCKKLESNTEGDQVKLDLSTIPTIPLGAQPPAEAPEQVQNLVITLGDNPGELDPTWDGQNPAPRFFKVRMNKGAAPVEAEMVEIGTPTASKMTKAGLESGAEYWFQVCAMGSGGKQGPWSDPAKGRAP